MHPESAPNDISTDSRLRLVRFFFSSFTTCFLLLLLLLSLELLGYV
jgi:hypothetical protein